MGFESEWYLSCIYVIYEKVGENKQYAAISLHNRWRYGQSIPGKFKKLDMISELGEDFFICYAFLILYILYYIFIIYFLGSWHGIW